ncbi:MAG TPA: aldo/keto reductase [Chthoniobacterales bacterium]
MSTQTYLKLHDGHKIPQLGFGTWQTPNDVAPGAVRAAIEAGYRSIDTAAIYENETGTGEGIRQSGVPREQLYITTKLWNDDQGFDTTLRAFDESLKRLKLDAVDLYLIHWPKPRADKYADTWRALVKIKESGRAKSIGVSNFSIQHLQRLFDEVGVIPTVNQIELHPRFQQKELREFHAQNGILTESWSPLGQGTILKDPTIGAIAQKHGKSPAQVIIRWHIDSGLLVIPKSVTASRIRENFDVFDFTLDADDLVQIGGLDTPAGRIGPDPETAPF